jgi:ADP-ribosylglycohydrolase
MEETLDRLFDKVLGCLVGGIIGDAMGSPAEGKSYLEIKEKYGEINDFSGVGTDDSALKHILCNTIIKTEGYPTADAWAEEWLNQEDLFLKTRLFYTPVMNAFWKLRAEDIPPREAGNGNMASSSSAMCISPMGIINAGNPRQAALETYEVTSLIHHNFCRDAACAIASAVAEAFNPESSVDSIIRASTEYLPSKSASIIREAIECVMNLAKDVQDYSIFRERYYKEYLVQNRAIPDARETVPVALALFYLADGDPKKSVMFGANFGRDADTIASMAGSIAGAFKGASNFPKEWIDKVEAESPVSQKELAEKLTKIAVSRIISGKKLAEKILVAFRKPPLTNVGGNKI